MTSAEDKTALQALVAELSKVLEGIVTTAEQKACERCPYMNVRIECTAEFSCKNQVFRPGREQPLCSGQHKINFAPPVKAEELVNKEPGIGNEKCALFPFAILYSQFPAHQF